MTFNDIPLWAKHGIGLSVVTAVSFFAGRYATPEKVVTRTVDRVVEKIVTRVDEKETERRVAEMRASLEREWAKNTHVVTTTRPDGTTVVDSTTSDTGHSTSTKVEIKYVDRVVEKIVIQTVDRVVEKIVEKTVVSQPDWRLHATLEPLPALKQEYVIGLQVDRRILGSFGVSTGLSSNLVWKPTWTLGLWMEL